MKIRNGIVYPTNQRSVTLHDIAERCGVSMITVSRALRDDRRNVSEQTIARVKAMAEELGYDPQQHVAARRLALRKHGLDVLNRIVTLVFPQNFQKHPYYAYILSGVLDVLLEEQFGLLISYEVSDSNTVFPDCIRRGEVDGVMFFSGSGEQEKAVHALRQHTSFGQRPIVSLNGTLPDTSAVTVDDFAGGYAMASHLLDNGHRHILHYYRDGYTFLQRRAGCIQAYRDRQLDPEVYFHNIYHHLPEDATAPNAWVEYLPSILSQTGCTGIIARYDEHALRMYRALMQVGIRVPEDISLVGYNDTDVILNEQGENILTTVRLPLTEYGQRAARLIIQRVTGQVTEDTLVVLPVEPVIRSSVVPPSR